MFDRYITHPGSLFHSSRSEVNVNEKRAPTDESIRILQEMEEKAAARILKSAVLTGEGVEVAYVLFDRVYHHAGYVLKIGMKFNGKFEMLSTTLTAQAMLRATSSEEHFRQLIADEAAKIFTKRMFVKLMTAAIRPGEEQF